VRRAILGGVLASAVLLSICGCSNNPTSEPVETRPVISGIARSAATVEVEKVDIDKIDSKNLPLDRYLPTNGENAKLQRAEALSINECMKKLNYPKNQIPVLPISPSRARDFRTGWFIVPPEEAAKYGYDSPPDDLSSRRASEDTAWQRSRTKIQDGLMDGSIKTFYGKEVPDGGCLGETARKITAGAPLGKSTVLTGGMKMKASDGPFAARGYLEMHIQAARNELTILIEKNPRWKSVTKSWVACMAKSGYRYASPEEAMADKQWSGSAGEDERAAAVADGKCMDEVNYAGVMVSLHSAYERSFIQRNQEFLKGLSEEYSKWQANAESVIKSTAK
jgi:hypothetical protein